MAKTLYFSCLLFLAIPLPAQYISEVLEYKPAPGQFINAAPWGMPDDNNPDVSIVGTLNGAMSLGAFGGYVIFKFEDAVENDDNNPYGIDFVIYGNPLQNILTTEVANRVTWAEPGIVYVMQDENQNGLADDTWYELAGSDYFFSTTLKNYEVTYYNPNSNVAADVPWKDNQGNADSVYANSFHTQPYYPQSENFPDVDETKYTLSGTRIKDYVDRSNPSFITAFGRPWGYVDNILRSTYDGTPDNPYTWGMDIEEEGSGGDGFDIDWAVDENGDYVDLDEIDFIKVQNGVLADAGWLGEVSTEITGAFDVAPDSSITGVLDMIIIKELPDTITGCTYQIEAFAYHKGRLNNDASLVWTSTSTKASVNDTNLLAFTTNGEVTLTATLSSNSEITASVSTLLNYEYSSAFSVQTDNSEISVYPNPASKNIYIEGVSNATIEIFNITGNKLISQKRYTNMQPISIANLPKGIYLIKVTKSEKSQTFRLIKE